MTMPPRPSEKGSIIVLAMLVTLIILGVGITAMWVASSGSKITGNITRRQEAMYAAEAGLERARFVLTHTPLAWSLLTLPVANGGTDCSATSYDDTVKGRVLCDGDTALREMPVVHGSLITTTADAGTAGSNFANFNNIQYTIYIRNDPAEAAINPLRSPTPLLPQFDSDRRVVIRVEGVGRDHLSYYALEAVITTPATALPENYISQHGGNAQNTNSSKANIPLPP